MITQVKNKSRFLKIAMGILLLFIVLFSSSVNAQSDFPEIGMFGNRNNIISSGSSTYTPDTGEYPFKEGATKVNFFDLYGDGKGLIVYKGEIPNKNDEDKYKQVLQASGSYVSGLGTSNTRKWTNTKIDNLAGEKNNDLHLWALNNSGGTPWASFILYFIASLPLKLANVILNIIFMFRQINIADIFKALNMESLMKLMNSVFLFNDSGISPFLILCLIGFVIGITGAIIKGIKGNNAFAAVKEDLFGFLISLFIVAVALTGRSYQIGDSITNLITNFETQLAAASTEGGGLFVNSTGDASKDNVETNKALLKKNELDILIEAQFGRTVDKLTLGKGNFGQDEVAAKSKVADGFNFVVKNSNSAEEETYENLGYYLWAANSNVSTSSPLTNNGKGFKSASNERVLAVVDYLNEIYKSNNSTSAEKEMAKDMVRHLAAPSYLSASGKILLLGIRNIIMILTLFTVMINIIIGKILVILVWLLLPVIGPLYMFRKTKPFAKQLMGMFILGFIKLTVYSLIFDTIISVCGVISANGIIGIMVSMALLWFLKSKLPDWQAKLDDLLMKQMPPEYKSQLLYAANRSFSRDGVNRGMIDPAKKRFGRFGDRQVVTKSGEVKSLKTAIGDSFKSTKIGKGLDKVSTGLDNAGNKIKGLSPNAIIDKKLEKDLAKSKAERELTQQTIGKYNQEHASRLEKPNEGLADSAGKRMMMNMFGSQEQKDRYAAMVKEEKASEYQKTNGASDPERKAKEDAFNAAIKQFKESDANIEKKYMDGIGTGNKLREEMTRKMNVEADKYKDIDRNAEINRLTKEYNALGKNIMTEISKDGSLTQAEKKRIINEKLGEIQAEKKRKINELVGTKTKSEFLSEEKKRIEKEVAEAVKNNSGSEGRRIRQEIMDEYERNKGSYQNIDKGQRRKEIETEIKSRIDKAIKDIQANTTLSEANKKENMDKVTEIYKQEMERKLHDVDKTMSRDEYKAMMESRIAQTIKERKDREKQDSSATLSKMFDKFMDKEGKKFEEQLKDNLTYSRAELDEVESIVTREMAKKDSVPKFKFSQKQEQKIVDSINRELDQKRRETGEEYGKRLAEEAKKRKEELNKIKFNIKNNNK